MTALAERYAKGAMAAAAGPQGGEALVQDLEKFVACMAESDDLNTALTHPALRHERGPTVEAVAKALGVGPVTQRLLQLLVRRRRVPLLGAITEAMRVLVDEASGVLRANIVSAMPMDAPELRALQEALQKRLGRAIQAAVRVDASLIGGMVCEVGSLTFDNSVKNQLALMAQHFGVRAP